MAKRFFCVCGGLLCLAIAFQLGATSAGAQGAGQVAASAVSGATNAVYAITSTADLYERVTSTPASAWTFLRSFSVSAPVIGLEIRPDATYTSAIYTIFCQDGTVYEWERATGVISTANVFSGATTTQQTSFGSLKVRYR